jgi:hypothetical protein
MTPAYDAAADQLPFPDNFRQRLIASTKNLRYNKKNASPAKAHWLIDYDTNALVNALALAGTVKIVLAPALLLEFH